MHAPTIVAGILVFAGVQIAPALIGFRLRKFRPMMVNCPICAGEGAVKSRYLSIEDHPCSRCDGTGKVQA